MLRFALFFLVTSTAWAQTARVEGRVVTPDGSPVPKAMVTLSGGGGVGRESAAYVEISGRDGSFVAENLPPGVYGVGAGKAGYAQVPSSLGAITLLPGELRRGVEAQLQRLGIVDGTVVDADGNPLMDATVLLIPAEPGGPLRDPLKEQRYGGSTDDRGRFRIPMIAAASYYVYALSDTVWRRASTANANQQEGQGASARQTNLPTYYPNAETIASASVVDVTSSPIENLSIHMRRGIGYTVRARVEGGPDAPAGINLIAQDGGRTIYQLHPVAGGWQETENVIPGRYLLFAQRGRPTWIGSAFLDVVDQDLNGLVVALRAPVDIDGKIVTNGKPVPPDFSVWLRFDDSIGMGSGEITKVNPDGTFHVGGLSASRYQICQGFASASAGAVALPRESLCFLLDLTRGNLGPLELELP